MSTGVTSRPKRPSPDSPSLDELNARLDHINCNLHPITPYVLTIPSDRPVELAHEQQRRSWIKGTLFPFREGHLQYISNFKDWSQGLIHPVGGWDDGKGGVAQEERPLRQSPMTPQHPPKKIKLGDYAKKRAAGELRPNSPNPPPRDEAIERRTARAQEKGKRPYAHSNGVYGKGPDVEAKGSSKPSPPISPVPKSHESLLPSEDLPPPLTPLPPRLAAAVAEYREHLKSHKNGNTKGPGTPIPATKAYRRYQKRVEQLNAARSGASSNLIVTLKFRKRHKQYGDLAKDLTLHPLYADHIAQKLSKEAVMRLRRLGDDLIKESRASEAGKNALLVHLEGVLCHLVYAKLVSRTSAESREHWETTLKLLSEFAELCQSSGWLSVGGPKDAETSDSEEDVPCHLINTLVSVTYRELSDFLGDVGDNTATMNQDLCRWLKAEALDYALRATHFLSAKRISTAYPKIWDDSSDTSKVESIADTPDWTTMILTGSYCFPLANGTCLEAVRGVRRLLLRFGYEAGLEPQDKLGAFAAKSDAAV